MPKMFAALIIMAVLMAGCGTSGGTSGDSSTKTNDTERVHFGVAKISPTVPPDSEKKLWRSDINASPSPFVYE